MRVAVIGGGIVGAAAAYELAKRGQDVVLIDRSDSGKATAAAAGIISPWVSKRRSKAWYEMVKRGARYYPSLVKELAAIGIEDTGYEVSGALYLDREEARLEKLLEITVKRREEAPEIGEIVRLSKEEVQEKVPVLGDDFFGMLVSGGAKVDGRKMCAALVGGAKHFGAEVVDGNASLHRLENGKWMVSVEDGEMFKVDTVVVAAGAWAPSLLAPLGVDLLVSPQKATIVHSAFEGEGSANWPVVKPPGTQYMLTFTPNIVVNGTTYVDVTSFDHTVEEQAVESIREQTNGYAPGMEGMDLLETRVGFRPVVPSAIPVMGEIPAARGIYVVNGLGASGLTSGPYLGAELARKLCGEEVELDWELYKVESALKKEV